MKLALGIKTDAIETRYSFEWLFDLLVEEGITQVQLGSFFELYDLEDSYFVELRQKAESRGLRIKSVFTAHRELGGFFYNDVRMEKVARRNLEQLIHVASLVGADYVGSNPGAVYRDRMQDKAVGIGCYLRHMQELAFYAKQKGLKALTMEPMSCLGEPPTTPEEMAHFCGVLNAHHAAHPQTTVPTWLCGDISHGLANAQKQVIHDNIALFKAGLPMMCEFHFKNTDALFNSTFGFSPEECKKGIVDLAEIRRIVEDPSSQWPVDDVVGYLEIMGPKIGRDYSDPLLGEALRVSLRAIKQAFA